MGFFRVARVCHIKLHFFQPGSFLLGHFGTCQAIKTVGNTPEQPYFLVAFWTMTTVNLVLLTPLIFGGIRLLQLRTLGVGILQRGLCW